MLANEQIGKALKHLISLTTTRDYQGELYVQAGALCEACQRYATEAGRLQPAVEADELVREFSSLAATLEKQLSMR